jgi:FlaA1/EpsC-like NDP-sugar epimerase
MLFDNKHILITGGTGSLGRVLLHRLINGEQGTPERILIFSRDEAKQSDLQNAYSTDPRRSDIFKRIVRFQIGDIRDYASVLSAMRNIHIVFNAAALKQVPACEYSPWEAARTNIEGAENIIRAIEQRCWNMIETVIGISTDKACKPVNVMGMTKAIQERLFLSASSRCPHTRFVCVRYGNVLASRGSVIPLFKEQIKRGGPVTVTTREMTRFLLSLDAAVDTVFAAVESGLSGETYIPRISSARVMDIAHAVIGCRDIEIKVVGIRPGEKIHEILISEEELPRTVIRGDYYVISSVFSGSVEKSAVREFSSENVVMDYNALASLLYDNGLLHD